MEDYVPAAESLTYFLTGVKDGATFLPDVLAFVDHSSIPGAEKKLVYDELTRDLAVRALHKLAKTKAQRDQVAQGLMAIIERGSCSVYEATACQEVACNRFGGASVVHLAKSLSRALLSQNQTWPRSAEEETCFNCGFCTYQHVGLAFGSAVKWFAANPAYRPRVEAILRRQVKARTLPKREFEALQKSLRRPPAGF
jgi:hypothetical protein